MNEKKIIQFPTPEERLEKTLEPVAPIFEEAEEEREHSVEQTIGGPKSELPYVEEQDRERLTTEKDLKENTPAYVAEKESERMRDVREGVKREKEKIAAAHPDWTPLQVEEEVARITGIEKEAKGFPEK